MEVYTRTDKDRPEIEVLIEVYKLYGVTVPIGFEFDGASTPRILWSVLPPFKRVKKAALLHDFLCRYAKTPEERKEADRVFLKALRATSGINEVRCKLGYWGVRLGAFFGSGVRYPHWSDKLRKEKN